MRTGTGVEHVSARRTHICMLPTFWLSSQSSLAAMSGAQPCLPGADQAQTQAGTLYGGLRTAGHLGGQVITIPQPMSSLPRPNPILVEQPELIKRAMMIARGNSVSSVRATQASVPIKAPFSVVRPYQLASHGVRCPAPASGVVAMAAKGFGASKPPKKETAKERPARPPAELCPCESDKVYPVCCKPAHEGTKRADTLEAAIRARFSAYRMGNKEYILSTFHPTYADFHYEKPMEEAREQLEADVVAACENYEFYNLKIVKIEMSGDDEGEIAFSYKSGPRGSEPENFDTTNEKNRFLKVDGMWLFADYQRFQYNSGAVFSNLETVSVKPAPAQQQQ